MRKDSIFLEVSWIGTWELLKPLEGDQITFDRVAFAPVIHLLKRLSALLPETWDFSRSSQQKVKSHSWEQNS